MLKLLINILGLRVNAGNLHGQHYIIIIIGSINHCLAVASSTSSLINEGSRQIYFSLERLFINSQGFTD